MDWSYLFLVGATVMASILFRAITGPQLRKRFLGATAHRLGLGLQPEPEPCAVGTQEHGLSQTGLLVGPTTP